MPGDNNRQHKHAIPLEMGDSFVIVVCCCWCYGYCYGLSILYVSFRQYATIDNSDRHMLIMYQSQNEHNTQ